MISTHRERNWEKGIEDNGEVGLDPVGEAELAHVAQVPHQETRSVAAQGRCHLFREDKSENDKDTG